MLGKTNMDEFAMGSSTENSAYGPTLKPWTSRECPAAPPGLGGRRRRARTVGARLRHGGSIKQPAALCGVVGLRPTYGTVSRYGIVAFASSLDQIGPITKTVADCAFLSSRDCRARSAGHDDGRPACPGGGPRATDLSGLRVGVPKQLNEVEGIEPGVKEAVARAIALCEKLGAEVDDCELPLSVEYGLACYYLIARRRLPQPRRYDGVRFGPRAEGEGLLRDLGTDARRRLRRRAQAASCLARTRYPPAITTRSTGRPRRCAR